VSADPFGEFFANGQQHFGHGHSSSQKRSLKYFDAESAKIVTMFCLFPARHGFATANNRAMPRQRSG